MGVLCCRSMAYELHTALQNFMRLFIFPCAGNVGLPPLNLYARVRIFLCTLHTRPRVQRASGIPCALSFREGQNLLANLGPIVPRERRCISIPSKLNRPSRPHKGRDQEGVRPTLTFPDLMRPCAVIQRLPPHQFLLIFKAKCSPKTATFR